jgi:uncharacterized protein
MIWGGRVDRDRVVLYVNQAVERARTGAATLFPGRPIEVPDVSEVAVSAAVDEAGVEINEVAFTFQTETQRDLRQKAIADAVVTARKNATAAATAEDMSVGSVQSIVTDPGSRPRRLRAGQALAMDTTESGSVESGPIEVSVSVDVEYRLEEP